MVKKLLFRRRSKDNGDSKSSVFNEEEGIVSRRSKKLNEYNRSLKRSKKRDAVRQILFSNDEKSFKKKDEEEECIYESRKLLIRQMQGMIAKEVKRANVVDSEYDSWSDLEENFAKVYEPIPLEIRMETWKKMSKSDILREVKSLNVRKEFECLSKGEILRKIEKMHKSAEYLSQKFGIEHLVGSNDEGRLMKESVENPIKFGFKAHDSWSSRASSILKNPESIYVSREEVIKNIGGCSVNNEPKKRLQDSWSSRASSIINKLEVRESTYMSRAELIRKLNPESPEIDIEKRSLTSFTESDVSTVRNCPVEPVEDDNSRFKEDQNGQVDCASFNSECEYSEDDVSSCSCSSCVSYTDCSCCDTDNETVDRVIINSNANEYDLGDCCSKLSNGSKISIKRTDSNTSSNLQCGNNEGNQMESFNFIPKGISKVKQMQLLMEKKLSEGSHARFSQPTNVVKEDEKAKEHHIRVWKQSDIEDSQGDARRQKNQKLLKKHLKELSIEWDNTVNDLNTLRRSRVLKELQKYLKDKIDFDAVEPENFTQELNIVLRRALDSNFEAFTNLNIGRVYVPMEENPNRPIREMTDYDTFGSIDSLIFEPKTPSQEDIQEAQEEIEYQFKYLENEKTKDNDDLSPGKTTFAERVRHFQNLGNQEFLSKKCVVSPVRKMSFRQFPKEEEALSQTKDNSKLDTSVNHMPAETSWKEVAAVKTHQLSHSEGFPEHPVEKSTVTFKDSSAKAIFHENNESSKKYDEELVSFCSQCQAGASMCTQCTSGQPVSHVLSSATTSWNYIDSLKDNQIEEEEEEDADSIEVKPTNNSSLSLSSSASLNFIDSSCIHINKSVDLRQKLKDSFGAAFEPPPAPPPPPPIDSDFLVEYSKKVDLDEEISKCPILVRDGETVPLTEEMFRGEFHGSLQRFEKRLVKKVESETGDSGIVSPPISGRLYEDSLISPRDNNLVYENDYKEKIGEEDLNNDKCLNEPLSGVRKQDTMIRELKTKLKERFPDETVDKAPECRSSHQRDIRVGTVQLGRQTLGPKLSKLFGSVKSEKEVVLPISLSKDNPTDYESSVYDPSLPEELKKTISPGIMFRGNRPFTPPSLQNLRHQNHFYKEDSRLVSKQEKPEQYPVDDRDRESLYGPGGIFGPHGPFSTPEVRYPNGIQKVKRNFIEKKLRFVQIVEAQEENSDDPGPTKFTSSEVVKIMPKASSTPSASSPMCRMQNYKEELIEEPSNKEEDLLQQVLPEDILKWKEEKAKRMLTWINKSQLVGYWGSEVPPWWKAKQRASIKFLLSKAYNHKTPEELVEPFYSDHDDIDRLKPHIVHALANAELYCMALSHLYQDPNYHNLNHWGIIQALARKGIYVAEPTDCNLTETVLIQTTPLKMSAHMAVTEALMSLFIKETVSIERVANTTRRILGEEISLSGAESFTDQEISLLSWMNACCTVLQKRTEEELQLNSEDRSTNVPVFPLVKELTDLSDGVGLSGIISLYCPEELIWREIALGSPPSMADSLYNIQLVHRFCKESLSFNFCHLSIEDIVYMHDSIKLNVICFLADLFNNLEVRPIRNVALPGVTKERVIEVPDPACPLSRGVLTSLRSGAIKGQIPDLRPSLDHEPTHLRTDMHRIKSPNSCKRTSSFQEKIDKNEEFVVQRGKAIVTLNSLNKEEQNTDTKSDERGETGESACSLSSPSNVFEQMRNIPVAGRPSDSPVRRGPSSASSFAGRRSRRNSVDENSSQLSLENLGGSSENLSILGRNPDKEMKVHTGRKTPNNDRNSLIDNRNIEEMELRDNKTSSGSDKVSFADFRRQKARDQFSGINITYMQQEKVDPPKRASPPAKEQLKPAKVSQDPNVDGGNAEAMASQLNDVRMKLEHRRKRIEEEKKRMESVMAKQREKVGQQAFLRAVVKGNKKEDGDNKSGNSPNTNTKLNQTQRPVTLKDLDDDLKAVQSKWCNEPHQGTQRTPDIESMDIESYSRSLHAMNDSLHDLQSDIQRLSQQQGQIQQMMHHNGGKQPHRQVPSQANPMDPQPFYIAQPEQPQQRRTWGQPQPISFAHQAALDHTGWQQQQGRRPQWTSPHMPRSHLPHGPPVGYYGPQSSQYDPYSSPMRDQWGNPIHPPPPHHHQMYPNGSASHPYDQYGYGPMPSQQQHQRPQEGPPGYPMYYDQYNSPPSGGPYNGNASPQLSYMSSPSRTPFRLHDNKSSIPSASVSSPSITPSRVPSAFANRGSSDVDVSPSPPPIKNRSLSRQTSRESTGSRNPEPSNSSTTPRRIIHSSIPAPEEDDMAPQNVSFIEESNNDEEVDEKDTKLSDRLSNLNISSGSKTYRVTESSPSPTRQRPTLSSTFKQNRRESGGGAGGETSGPSSLRSNSGGNLLTEEEAEILSQMKTEKLKDDANSGLGFVISFGDDAPKKPKPQLKPRRPSTKKPSVQSELSSDGSSSSRKENVPPDLMICIDMNMGEDRLSCTSPFKKSMQNGDSSSSPNRSLDSQWHSNNVSNVNNNDRHLESEEDGFPKFEVDPEVTLEPVVRLPPESGSESDNGKNTGLIVGNVEADAEHQDEMQRKKERIMMQSLKRKQQAEENRIKKEEMARLKKQEEAFKDEEKARKKDEEKARREAILEQHRLKKEMERLELENGRMPEPVSAKPVPKMRPKNIGGTGPSKGSLSRRPRPKTIHVDAADTQSLMSATSKRGSSSNISGSNLYRTESRNSVNNDYHPSLSIATMGKNKTPNSRPNSRTASRRGSTTYINDENSMIDNLPPSGLSGPILAHKRKPCSVSVEGSPRLSRMDRTMRSASQPRGKRDPSVSSAYAGDESRLNGRMRGENFRGSRESLASGITYNAARRGSNASVYDDNDYYYGGSMRDLSGRQPGRARKASSSSHIDIYSSATSSRWGSSSSSSSRMGSGSLRTLTHVNSLRRNQRRVSTHLSESANVGERNEARSARSSADEKFDSGRMISKSKSIANLSGLSGAEVGLEPLSSSRITRSSLISPRGGQGPGSLPGFSRRSRAGDFDDGASDISSTASGFSAYGYRSGTRLYREPASKSNRTIILNAIEYVVFPGAVNSDTRNRVLNVIDRCDCPHFLLLFRDHKCQFRGLYAYYPDTDEVYKIYGTGPKAVTDKMFEAFFKYNSGGKKFTKIHTKHLSVTIDAFTIHNSLWLGKKAKLPDKKDMALVI